MSTCKARELISKASELKIDDPIPVYAWDTTWLVRYLISSQKSQSFFPNHEFRRFTIWSHPHPHIQTRVPDHSRSISPVAWARDPAIKKPKSEICWYKSLKFDQNWWIILSHTAIHRRFMSLFTNEWLEPPQRPIFSGVRPAADIVDSRNPG